ncbi:ABC transporter ATP-binding protein [Hamadaea tsunoensis]|uniref:ABC transporter ATP-binding protein n=1 Tax=Hamadaea tsunoensis TaxID=53368 RepID=UPI0004048229|nr:ABC transporter ATP-binding protein [Hamadaea tsunoensis]
MSPSTPAAAGLLGSGLHLGYHGTPVVVDASIELAPAQVTALVGPNGSGKSTLLRTLARLHKPSAGDVRFADGSPALTLSSTEFARRVTLLAQSRPVPTGVRVRDVVAYGRHPYRGRWRDSDVDGTRAVAHAMAVTGTAGLAERCVDELSGGELQRVWLATCLAQDTGVLLLDEPTTYLDLRYQVEILDLTRELADDHGVAVGVVLHDLDQAAHIADTVVLLDSGRVRAHGTPAEVLTEELLTEVYGLRITTTIDPFTGQVHTWPVGRHAERVRRTPRWEGN